MLESGNSIVRSVPTKSKTDKLSLMVPFIFAIWTRHVEVALRGTTVLSPVLVHPIIALLKSRLPVVVGGKPVAARLQCSGSLWFAPKIILFGYMKGDIGFGIHRSATAVKIPELAF